MLRLKVYINDEQISNISIINVGHIKPSMKGIEFCDYRVVNVDTGNWFLIKHNRKKGWKSLVIKALKKLLKEK